MAVKTKKYFALGILKSDFKLVLLRLKKRICMKI